MKKIATIEIATIDCRSEEGLTIDSIDSIITACKWISGRDLSHPGVVEALKDLQSTPELKVLLNPLKVKSKKK
jgi:hypothetical protein